MSSGGHLDASIVSTANESCCSGSERDGDYLILLSSS